MMARPHALRIVRPQISHTRQLQDLCLIIHAQPDADPGCIDVEIAGPDVEGLPSTGFGHVEYVSALRAMSLHLEAFAEHLRIQARDYAEAAWQEAGIVI